MQATSDESLMQRYAKGDFEAFEALYERHKGSLFRYLSRQLHDQSLVDDVLQEVWGKVIDGAANYQSSAKFTTWLYTIARNKVIDHVRHVQVVNKVMVTPSEAGDDPNVRDETADVLYITPDKQWEQSAQASAIEHCMNKLPKHQLDCFLLREEAGFSGQQIADIVQLNLEATKSRLKVAYKRLRECLVKQLGHDNDFGNILASRAALGGSKEGGNE